MSAKDSELEELQHLVHTEKTKAARLQTLIKKRSNSSTSTQDPIPVLKLETGPSGDRNRGKAVNGTGVAQGASPVHRKLTVEAAIHPRSSGAGNGNGSSTGRSNSNSGSNSARGVMSARDREAK